MLAVGGWRLAVGGWRRDAAVQITGENIVMEFTIQHHTSLF